MNKFLKNPPKPPFPKKISCEYSTIQTHSFRIVTRLCHYSEDRIPVIFLGRLHSRNSQRPYCPMPLKHASVSFASFRYFLCFGILRSLRYVWECFGFSWNALVSLGLFQILWDSCYLWELFGMPRYLLGLFPLLVCVALPLFYLGMLRYLWVCFGIISPPHSSSLDFSSFRNVWGWFGDDSE